MHDKIGCIKVNIEGPDIVLTPYTVPADMKAVMREQPLVHLDSKPLEKPRKRAKSSVEEMKRDTKVCDISEKQLRNRSKSCCNHSHKKRRQSRLQGKSDVPVLYVYSISGPAKYKFVERCPQSDEPVFSIPVGLPIKSNNKR